MAVTKIGVVGCGLMGGGIAQVAAQAGFPTTVVEANQALLDRGFGAIRKNLVGLVEKGRLETGQRDATWARLTGSLRLEDLGDADLVIEAITENVALKKETFERLDRVCAAPALLATNTSSCTVTELAAATRRPGQVLGLHFFNPAPVMKLVEVIRTILTSDQTIKTAWDFVQALGKTPVAVQDTTGFIVNRLLVPYLLEAVRVLESGVASREDIDQAMKLGCGYPMGPFTLLDLVGLDTTLFVAEVMFQEFREARFAPPPLLKRMVMAGQLGRKSGKGFYDYPGVGSMTANRGAHDAVLAVRAIGTTIAALALVGAAVSGALAQDKIEGNRYANERYGVQLDKPPGWYFITASTIIDLARKTAGLGAPAPGEDPVKAAGFAVIVSQVPNLGRDVAPQVVLLVHDLPQAPTDVPATCERLRSGLSDPEAVTPTRATTVDGRPAARLDFRGVVDGSLVRATALCTFRDRRAFIVAAQALAAEFDAVAGSFEAILRSFRLK